MIVSQSEAARLAGKSRQTIYRYVKNGKLSVSRMDDGSKGVDTSELQRVFGSIKAPVTDVTATTVTQSHTVQHAESNTDSAPDELLKQENQFLKDKVRSLEEDKAFLKDQVEAQRLLLEDKSESKGTKIDRDASWLLIIGLGFLASMAALIAYTFLRF